MRIAFCLTMLAIAWSPVAALAADSPEPAATVTAAAPDAPPVAPPSADAAAEPAMPAAVPQQAADAPKIPAPLPAPTLVARINLTTQRMEVSSNGKVQQNWAISSGRSGYITPNGKFRVQWTARSWFSRKYDLAPMPHSVFFNGGIAVHGTNSVGMLGQPASHGCVRLSQGNAAQFYAMVHKHGQAATQIIVMGRTPGPRIARRDRQPWDQPGVRQANSDRRPRYGYSGDYQPSGWTYAKPRTFVYGGVRYMQVR
jgi:lipoprotein-anchoring transpeptidase ErfK/SrfK